MTEPEALLRLSLVAFKEVTPEQLAAERKLHKKLEHLFAHGVYEVLKEIRHRGAPSNELERAYLASRVVPDTEDYAQTILDSTDDMVDKAARQTAKQVGTEITRASDRVHERLKNMIFEASQQTLRRLRGDIQGNLAHAYREGMGIEDAAKYIDGSFESMQEYELRRVARTEIVGAQNRAAHDTLDELGVEYEQWVAELDDRTRESHADLHGQITRTGENFSNGLRYAGDRSGPIDEWIQCRCTTAPFLIPEGYQAPSGKQWFYEGELIDVRADTE